MSAAAFPIRSNNPWAASMATAQQQPYTMTNPQYSERLPYDDGTGGPSSQMDAPPSYTDAVGPSAYQRPVTYVEEKQHHYQSQYDNDATYSERSRSGPSMYQTTSPDLDPEDIQILDQALNFTNQQAPRGSSQHRLRHPVAVPQVASGMGMPFARAYSRVLAERGISMDEFIEFVDNLNVVSTASPPLQILDLAGGIVSMVPHHITKVVGHSISGVSKLTTFAVSKGRSTMFMKKANADFFAPRGLKVELASSAALKAKIGLNPEAQMVVPLACSQGMGLQERRLRVLDGYIAPLTSEVPPPNKQTNALERMSAGQVKMQIGKSEKKALKDRQKALEKAGELRPDGSVGKNSKAERDLQKELRKIGEDRDKVNREAEKDLYKESKDARKIERKRGEEMRKLDEETEKVYREYEKESRKDRQDADKEDKEVEKADKILWLLVEDL